MLDLKFVNKTRSLKTKSVMRLRFEYYFHEIRAELKMLESGLQYSISKKKKAIYVGCLGMNNLGDEAVFTATKILLKSKLFLYATPYFKPFAGRFFRRYFFSNPSYIILGGGTLILKGETESFLRIVVKYHKQYPNAELVVLGTGVADMILAKANGFPTNIHDWSGFFNSSAFISVRGVLSKKALMSAPWNIAKDIKLLHDPAIFYHHKEIIKKKKRKHIALNFCNIAGRIYGQNQNSVDVLFRELVSELLRDGWTIFLYPTVISDIPFMRNQLGNNLFERVKVYKNHTDLQASLEFFNDIDVFIGQRLHSIIFAAVTNTPFFAIEYESKTSDFLLSLGYDKRSMRTDQLDLSYLLHILYKIYENIDIDQQMLYKLCAKAKKEQMKVINEFLKHVS